MYRNRDIPPKIIIFSGSGLSAESGIPTYRETEGTWENYKIEEVCDEFTWKHNFQKVHDFYNMLRKKVEGCEPNEGHKTVKRIQDMFPEETIVITQNVDNLLERAGVKDVIHVHGDITKMRCEACGHEWDIGYDEHDTQNRCNRKSCDSIKGVRPDIVFFGGQAPMYSKMLDAFNHTMNPDTIVVVVGTMGNVINIESMVSCTPCSKFLNNLTPSPDIRTKDFTEVFYEPCTVALPKIEEIIYELKETQCSQ